jgi:hypothetical protein
MEFPTAENNQLQLGKAILTKAGEQLATVSGAEPRDGFLDYLTEKWRKLGYTVLPESN